MTLTIHPDPQERAGGYAFLELPEGSLPDQGVSVAVFDAYGERWLAPSEGPGERIGIGDANWQSDRVEFGPYEVFRHDGADWVRIGPEIVNKLDEYAPLRIAVGGQSHDVAWPDTVPPRAGAAVVGGLQAVARKPTGQPEDRLVGKVPADPPPAEEPEGHNPPGEDSEGDPLENRRGSLLLLNLLLTALAVAAFVAWYFWPQDTPEPVAEAAGDRCSLAALGAVTGGFERTADAIRECGADVSPDTALSLIEEAAARDDGAALLLFGTLYDGTQLDPRIENLTGLSFDDDPAKAAEYYARAVKAGATDATERLQSVCQILSGSDATLAKGAYDDFCS